MTTIQKKSLKVGSYVDTNHVDTVIRNYKRERWVHNSEHIGKEDSLSVWYSVEELEGFIERIKANGGDGIKMYFAAYPENFEKRPEYSGRQTIVMVATRSRQTEAGVANKDLYTNPGQILAYNLGSICPPNCGTGGQTKPPSKPGETGDADDWGGIGVTIVDRGAKGLTIV
ncbi:hypothetical protein [Paraflavitalea sp. CAU 1676]|jgi:hypothetical protein|uniref:hypothetical protein n=1 Tax=Paraflavitalea sp. CAU 1676 TaxID=3032598 RepID=UPI0023D99DF7|nr:hypothetical protein [Paraflavitalea sp. CAU 1676]MDF2193607.1 hypothetical protein [Paraflavitalea sp. CAU 1676]